MTEMKNRLSKSLIFAHGSWKDKPKSQPTPVFLSLQNSLHNRCYQITLYMFGFVCFPYCIPEISIKSKTVKNFRMFVFLFDLHVCSFNFYTPAQSSNHDDKLNCHHMAFFVSSWHKHWKIEISTEELAPRNWLWNLISYSYAEHIHSPNWKNWFSGCHDPVANIRQCKRSSYITILSSIQYSVIGDNWRGCQA